MKKALSIFCIALSLSALAATQTSKEYVDRRDNETLSHANEYTDDSVRGLAHDEDIPTKVSQLQNDTGYVTGSATNGLVERANSYSDEKSRQTLLAAKQYTDNATNGQSKVMSVNGHTGKVVLSSVDVHARPDNWMPSAEDVGAQPKLVSGVNIKTVNGNSLLGSGNIFIRGGASNSVDGAARPLPKYLHALDFDDSYPAEAAEYYHMREVEGEGEQRNDSTVGLGPSPSPNSFACSALRRGGFLYRNFDYPFDDRAEFVVRMSAGAGRFASVGVAQVGTNLTEALVTSGKPSPCYKWLPGATVDGINENGVVAEINVVDGEPQWKTSGDIHPLGGVRWVLDHATSALDAATNLASRIAFPAGWTQNFHYMVADETITYIVENGEAHQVPSSSLEGAVLTNFRLFPTRDTTGAGQERYDLLLSSACCITNAWFTNAYRPDTTPPWVSEFEGDLAALAMATNYWASKPREQHRGETFHRSPSSFAFDSIHWWQTVHTSIYDITNRVLRVAVQETDDWYTFQVPVTGNGGSPLDIRWIASGRNDPATVVGTNATAIGANAAATNDSVAVGANAVATGSSVAIGSGARITSNNSGTEKGVAIGANAKVTIRGGGLIALGANAEARGMRRVQIGPNDGDNLYYNTYIGTNSIPEIIEEETYYKFDAKLDTSSPDYVRNDSPDVTNSYVNIPVATDPNIVPMRTYASPVMLFYDNIVPNYNGLAMLGKLVPGSTMFDISGTDNVVYGSEISMNGGPFFSFAHTNNVLVGSKSLVLGSDVVAVGNGITYVPNLGTSQREIDGTVVIGNRAKTETGVHHAVIIGSEAQGGSAGEGEYAVAIGSGAKALHNLTTAIGAYSSARGYHATAIGAGASAYEKGVSIAGGTASFGEIRIGDYPQYHSNPDRIYFGGKKLSQIIADKTSDPGNYAAVSNAAMWASNEVANIHIDATDPTFSNAVLAVQISTNDFAALYALKEAFADLPIDPVTGGISLGALLAALASAVAWLKKNALLNGKRDDGSPDDEKLRDFFKDSNTLLGATIAGKTGTTSAAKTGNAIQLDDCGVVVATSAAPEITFGNAKQSGKLRFCELYLTVPTGGGAVASVDGAIYSEVSDVLTLEAGTYYFAFAEFEVVGGVSHWKVSRNKVDLINQEA